jgi:hypothetical protein
MTFTTKITPGYETLRLIYLSADAWETDLLEAGRATVLLEGDKLFSSEGNLNNRGGLTGMAKLYRRLGLKPGDEIAYEITSKNTIVVKTNGAPAVPPPLPGHSGDTVFQKKQLHHIHIEPFRPENLNHWEPATETDVYLAFGVLQEYTDFQYCCGASKELLLKLGAYSEDSAKPDAILIDRATDQYLMAEWKMKSSQFPVNHKPEDVDVLVCWYDDASDKTKLPSRVVSLMEIAKKAAEESLSDSAV